jgi:outer membrane receptor for ferrienterochelin and colicins
MLRILQILSYLLFIPSVIFSQVKLSGRVTGGDTTVVGGATISIVGTTIGTVTDKTGYYHINKIEPGTYIIRASFVGFETQEQSINIINDVKSLNFSLKEANIDLNEVVVTGTKSEKTLKNAPVLTQVISARKMLELGITNATDALQNMVPGINIRHDGTLVKVTLQGMDGKYVLFLIDGERIAGEVDGDVDYSMLNLENIDHIEVIKGASSSLYGSNAIGGVINIITKKINEPFDAKLYSRYSKFNELYTGGSIGLKKGIIGSRTSVNFSRTDGYDITPDSPHDWTQNPYSTYQISQKFEITPSSKFSLTPYFTYYQFERANVSARHAHDLYIDLNAGLKGQYFIGKSFIDFSYYRDRYNTYSILEQLNNRRDTVSYDIIQTFRTQGNFHLSDRNTLTAGLEYNTERLFSTRVEGGIRNASEAVIYLQEDIRIGERWDLIAGLRGSNHSNYGFNAAPKISLMYKQEPFNFRASAGTGFRSPALKDLYLYFEHFGQFIIEGNPQLKPESSKYISGSVEFSRPWNNSSVTVYRNVLSNMITEELVPLPDSTSETTYQYQNISSATIYGIDFLSKQKITKGIWASAGYSYVHSRDNETHDQLYNTTKNSGNISVDYNFSKKNYSFTAQLYCQLMSERIYLDPVSGGTAWDRPYSSWRFTISQGYKWLRISTGLDNIFGVVIPNNYDFISPGRRFFVGMNIDFGKIK